MHALLLALLLAVPLAGWAVASASPLAIPSYVFELVVVPHLPLPKSAAMEAVASWAHAILAWTTCALVAGHAGAAVVHAVALRDGTLRRMLSPRG
jgi:cytochrome b561